MLGAARFPTHYRLSGTPPTILSRTHVTNSEVVFDDIRMLHEAIRFLRAAHKCTGCTSCV